MIYQLKKHDDDTIYATSETSVAFDKEHTTWRAAEWNFYDPEREYFVEQAAEAAVPKLEQITPMSFYLCFTPQERIDIKASNDPMVNELWATYELSVQLGRDIDPNLASICGAISYLALDATDTPSGPGILKSKDRVQQILTGVIL